ncbi:DUF3618 domain-containing protein [Streptomyces sp. NBC_01803]|uniref:DUF3618 domain-containing protein n=1 Tax=Streptomyces sp. NBC_01803 TaxID=2975946 RepID=UPI002DD9171E|nr:DUF3618 domain-containing protein [Streptomyces sp. NBC_01803]WSA47234.1 DUF3618 domain-containing protein [Streptomyces sp. NBC_01803]
MTGGAETASTRELRERVADTREELGETVARLAARTDVKARVRQSADRATRAVRGNPVPVVAGTAAATAAVVVSVTAVRAWRSR